MNKILTYAFLFSSLFALSQEADSTKTKLKISGSYEGNGQWYTNDKNRKIEHDSVPLRSNNYLNFNANYGKFTVGTQIESYTNEALLNFNPKFKRTDFATYYANYKSKKLDVTLGHYYVQFGSGMVLRTWEDRALGINNALRGGKIVYSPNDNISLTALYGRVRTGFDVAKGDVFGFNADVNISQLIKLESFDFKYGFSAVSRYEELAESVTNIEPFTNLFSNRFEFGYKNYYLNTEYVFKSRDAMVRRDYIDTQFAKEGAGLLINFGYSKKGFGFDANLRRVENMQLLAQRSLDNYPALSSTSINYNDKILNFIPSLTKQHHSNLANIYVYQSQFQVVMDPSTINKFGEIGGQFDLFYDFKKGTTIGGKYGTKVNLNVSTWYNLKAKFRYSNNAGESIPNYHTELFQTTEKYFSDYNIEITKKLSPKFKTAFTYINQYYNNRYIQGVAKQFDINSHTIFSESSYQLTSKKAITIGFEHMWADNDRKNWAGANVEYNHNEHWSIFAMDMYNYGFDEKSHLINENIDMFDIHFYNFGAAYKKGSTRIALNYGRQRGGLVCAGGVCRFVPPSTGLGIQISTSF